MYQKPSPSSIVDLEALDAICKRMKTFDEAREVVIKTCRDMQKAAKNAIFALHRGKFQDAEALLDKFKKATATLSPTLEAHPVLRISPSYVDAMEVRSSWGYSWRRRGHHSYWVTSCHAHI